MTDTALLAVALAAAAGLVAGRVWAAASRRSGPGEPLGVRASHHFVLALHHLATGNTDLARGELTKARRENRDSVEVALVLGDLLRATGQVERAIALHQELLERVDLGRPERAHVLACLGMDFLTAGFLDRAARTFGQVLELDPRNLQALAGIEKVQEDESSWGEAFHTRTRIARLRKSDESRVLASLQAEVGREAARAGQLDQAERAFRHALSLDRRAVSAYLGLADLFTPGDPERAASVLADFIRAVPDRAYHAFDRLAQLYATLGQPARLIDLLERLIRNDPHDWRARLSLARHLRAEGRPHEAHGLLLRALEVNPHALTLHIEMSRTLRDLGIRGGPLDDYISLAEHTAVYNDPHICSACRYRAAEALFRCPHCREWGTMVEERVAPSDSQA